MARPALRIQLCGGVGAAIDGDPVDVGPAKCQLVLAALALTPGKHVPQSRLIDLVWHTEPPATAERTLQSYVARLRKNLGPTSITRRGSAYCLAVSADAVDVARFGQHVDAGRVAEALAEWTGVPLEGIEAPGFAPAVTALTERWLDAVETDLRLRLEVEPATVVSRLTELTAQHPFREQLWALLMTALYRSGRQADALAAYQSAHHHLVDQLGLEPGPQLRQLEQMILGHDDRLGSAQAPVGRSGLEVEQPVGAGHRPESGDRRDAHLSDARLIGREHMAEAVVSAIENYPAVTLVGPGGIGKTSLALTVAARTASNRNVWVVELAETTSGEELPVAVADTLGIPSVRAGTAHAAIIEALADRATLLVLDNCEHVLQAATDLAADVVQRCPSTSILATSRERLGLTNERVVTVEPLDPSTSAIELFNERATALSHWFDPDNNREEVEAICKRLDGIPLAIELAAARATSLTATELRQRLESHHGLRLLTNSKNTDHRHATMQATIQWSYDLLSPAEQTVLQRLAIFATGFDLTAAEAVATDKSLDAIEVDRIVGSLVDQSMISIEIERTGRRFRFLEPIHDFADERRTQGGQARQTEERHTDWCLGQVTDIGDELTGWDEIQGVARLDQLWPELRAVVRRALARDDRDLVKRLISPILGEIVLRSRHEIGDWLEQLLDITPHDDLDTKVFALYWAAHRYSISQDPDGYRQLADRHAEPDHTLLRHGHAFAVGDHEAQARWAPAAGTVLRKEGRHHLAERTEINIAASLLNLGRFDEQETLTRDLIDRYRAQGPPTYLNWSLMLLGYNALFQERPDKADVFFNQAIDVDIPPRTHSPNGPIEARRAHRDGRHKDAYRILRDHVDDILATDNYQAGLLAFIEFINMMVAIDRTDDAAAILNHLEATGLLDNPAWRSLVTETDSPPDLDGTSPDLSPRDALQRIARVLDELTQVAQPS